MSLLDTASLIVTPNGYKEGKLYSVIPSDGSGDLSVTRATTATRVNSAGLIELVPYNIVNYSEQFDNAAWTKVDASVTANTTTAPDGTLTADTITDNSTLDRHITYQSLDSERSLTRTLSTYAKQGTLRYLALSVTITSDSTACYSAIFDLQTGTITATKNNGSATISASIENAGNGWYRCIISGALGNGFETIYPVIATSDRAGFTGSLVNNNLPIYAGSGQSLYIWGAQLNEGTLLPYQKTETRLNIPRLDYSNGTCPSLLVEPQRTNLVTYSSSFDNAAWVKPVVSVTANAATSPDGTQNADLIYPTSSASNVGAYQLTAGVTGIVGTVSCYVKSAGKNWALLGTDNTSPYNVSFDLVNGVVGSVPSGYSATIESVGNGWYRITTTYQIGSSLNYPFVGVADNTSRSVVPNGTDGIYAWGFQVEAGNYSTSYIPTTSASVTRNADVISKTGISSLIGQTEGVVFFDLELNNTPIADSYIFVRNSSASNYIGLRIQNNLIRYEGAVSASITCSIPKLAVANTRYKVALAYNTNDFAMYVNGDLIGTDNVGTIGSMDTLDLNFNLPGVNSYEFNSVALWKTRLTNTQLAQLTTI